MEILYAIAVAAGLVLAILAILLPVFVWQIASNAERIVKQNRQIIAEIQRVEKLLESCVSDQ
jgi:Na+-transporting methylmalonyl-CoA/oxaloacetate decarboxylase beta subunit